MKKRIYAPSWDSYELIDAGNGSKIERWGTYITIRPDVNAYFKPELSYKAWLDKAHFEFLENKGAFGNWKRLKEGPEEWIINYNELQFILQLRQTKHTGVFPEQSLNWTKISSFLNEGDQFLNLFAYTGASSVAALGAGATVFHVDSSKSALTWAKENQLANGFNSAKLVLEDALVFMDREIKRQRKYQLIQMDPPAWGIGTKGKKWQLENQIDLLIHRAAQLLDESGKLIVSTYSQKISSENLAEIAGFAFPNRKIESGILSTKSSSGKILEHGNILWVE